MGIDTTNLLTRRDSETAYKNADANGFVVWGYPNSPEGFKDYSDADLIEDITERFKMFGLLRLDVKSGHHVNYARIIVNAINETLDEMKRRKK